MQRTADAVIIGGGIMGASCGHFLAKAGVGSVALLERRTLAAVSTGHSAANVRCSYSNTVTVQLALRAMEMFENDREELGGPTGFRRTGQLILYGPEHAEIGRQVLANENRHGTGTREISIDDVTEIAPQLSPHGIAMACHQPRAGYADPVRTTRTLVEAAERYGLRAYQGAGARGIAAAGGRVTGVETDQGRIDAPLVVNAAGPWGGRLGAASALGYSIRWSRESDMVVERPAGFGALPIVADPICHIYFRPHGDDGVLAGLDYPKELEPLDIDDYDPALDDATRARIETGLFQRLPALRGARLMKGWASIYTITDDWHPVVGAEPELSGYYACFGGSGHGFKLGAPIGESLAAVITGATPRIDLHALRPARFTEGEPITSAWGSGNRA